VIEFRVDKALGVALNSWKVSNVNGQAERRAGGASIAESPWSPPLLDARGQAAGISEILLSSTTSGTISGNASVLIEYEDVTGKSSGRRSADRLGVGASDDFGGLNLIVIELPVRNVELKREGNFFGLSAMSFSER
jgi:hypothetical protein